jgi:hypothetical protein
MDYPETQTTLDIQDTEQRQTKHEHFNKASPLESIHTQ